mmetsp:Transcript_35695/g.82983  ORF Transcript_35695/g.82983 Transcript_35695/m.82983 type:complete len:393 (+) Transcript_35695:85-1263(+)
MWQVAGGTDQDGILVNEGQDPESPRLSEQLCAGAIVKELELVGNRLRYELVWPSARQRKQAHFRFLAERVGESVFGPMPERPVGVPTTGWVTVQSHGRSHLVPYEEPACHTKPASYDNLETWGLDGSLGFTMTVHMLSGQELRIPGMHPDMPLAVLCERVMKELGLLEGQELQLITGTHAFKPEDHARTLRELALDGEVPLTCVQRTILQPGDVVIVDGLVNAVELNNATGTCERWISERGRWRVQLSMVKFVKPQDLVVLPPAKVLDTGADVKILPTYVAPELVGAEGACERWLRSDLVEVRLVLSRHVRPQHLHLISHELAPEVAATMLPDLDSWEERDAQPRAGVNAALGMAFSTCGHPSSRPLVAKEPALAESRLPCSAEGSTGDLGH